MIQLALPEYSQYSLSTTRTCIKLLIKKNENLKQNESFIDYLNPYIYMYLYKNVHSMVIPKHSLAEDLCSV